MEDKTKTRGYDLAGEVPMFTVPVQILLREGLSLKYKINDEGDREVYIRETQEKLPDQERSLFGIITEYSKYGCIEDPQIEFITLDGFLLQHGLRCSQVIDYKVFREDKKYNK